MSIEISPHYEPPSPYHQRTLFRAWVRKTDADLEAAAKAAMAKEDEEVTSGAPFTPLILLFY